MEEDVERARVPSPVQQSVPPLYPSSEVHPIIADGADADPRLVSTIADQLQEVSANQGCGPSGITDTDCLIELAALLAFAVRYAVASPCYSPSTSSCSASDTPLQESCRKLLSAAESCILLVKDARCRHRLSLALTRSHALHGFSRLIAKDVELLRRAQEQLETEQKQQTTKLLHQPCQPATQADSTPATFAPVFVFGATAQSPSPTAPSDTAPVNTTTPPLFLPSYQWLKRQRLRLYHSLEEAARMTRWIYQGMILATGTCSACGCQLCRTSLDRNVAAGRTTHSHDLGTGQHEGQKSAGSSGSAAAGNGTAVPGSDGGGCLLVEAWRALHESALLEHLVSGSLALYGNPHAWDTDSGGNRSAGSCSGGGEAAGGAGARASGQVGSDSREHLEAAERAHLASRLRLEQEAQLEYQMRPGDSALQVVLHQLPGGLVPPAADHPAYPYIRACMARPGCQLALAASLVAAVCVEDGGPSYGLPYSVLTAAHGGLTLVATAEAGAQQGPCRAGEAWREALQDSMIAMLCSKVQAWISLGPERLRGMMFDPMLQPAHAHGPGFAVAVCRRLVAVCLAAWGEEGAQREGAAADGAGSDKATAAGEGIWRWLRGAGSKGILAQLVLLALRSAARIVIYEHVLRGIAELRAGWAAAGRVPTNSRELEEGVLRDSQWTPMWWWRLMLRAVPWLLTAYPGALADPRDAHLRHVAPLLVTTTSTPAADGVFPTVPPRDVANALKAGLLPFLERTLRHGYRELAARAGQPDPRVASVLSQTLLQPRKDWGWLLAYGDPHQVARLMRTCAQLLRQHVEQREADRPTSPSDLTGPLCAVADVLTTSCRPTAAAVLPPVAHPPAVPDVSSGGSSALAPWRVRCSDPRCPHCCPGAPWRGELCGGGGSSGAGGAPGICPARRLATNLSTALLHVMPALTHAVYGAAETGLASWAAEAAGSLLYCLTPMLVRVHSEEALQEQQRQLQQRPQGPKPAKKHRQRQANQRGGEGGDGSEAGGSQGQGQRPCWRAVVDSLEPIRLLKLQLRHTAEPAHNSTGELLLMLSRTHPEELGEAIRCDGELRDLMVARVHTAAGEELREQLQPLALALEPCKALEVLYDRLGLRRVPRAELARRRAGVRANVVSPMLVDVVDVVGLGVAG